MKNLTDQDLKVLEVLREHPQGAFLWQVQRFAEIERKEYALYYLKKLIKKGHAEKKDRLYHLKGDMPHAGSAIHITHPTQRPHAIRASAKLYASSASRAKESLEARGLSGKPIMKGSGLVVAWRGISLTLFKNGRLEMHPSLPEYPLNVPLEPILQKAAHEAGIWIEAFLSETGMRAIRDRLGRLAMEITYWENGYPRNEVARQTTEPGEKKVYAYDRKTGKEAIWADNSLNPFTELETNSPRADMVIKKMMQAMNDGELDPLDDVVELRRGLAELTQIQKTDTLQIAEYARQIALHLKVMKKIDEKLSQRRLFE